MQCQAEGCENPANAFLLTQGKYSPANGGVPEPRNTLCYKHYVEERRADGRIVACRALINGVALRDVKGTDVENRGDTVEFDADETNIDVLVACGFVERLDGPSLAETLAAEEEAMTARLAALKARRRDAEKQAKAEEKEAAKAAKEDPAAADDETDTEG